MSYYYDNDETITVGFGERTVLYPNGTEVSERGVFVNGHPNTVSKFVNSELGKKLLGGNSQEKPKRLRRW